MTLSIVKGSGSRFGRLTAPRKIEGKTGRGLDRWNGVNPLPE